MNIWLDDIRSAPENTKWDAHCFNARAAILLIKTGKVKYISFDHDLGPGPTGYDVALEIEELAAKKKIPPISYYIHSANPVGAQNIRRAMERAIAFWKEDGQEEGWFSEETTEEARVE